MTVETKSIVEVVGVNIGIFIKGEMRTHEQLEEAVRRGFEMLPLQFPNDSSNRVFLFCVINCPLVLIQAPLLESQGLHSILQ